MSESAVQLPDVVQSIADLWSPRIVARVNDHDVRVARFRGDYIWHSHADTDELFIVLSGQVTISLQRIEGEDNDVVLDAGSMFVVERGRRHRPASREGAAVLMIELSGTVTVGDERTVPENIPATSGLRWCPTGDPLLNDPSDIRKL